MSCTTDDCDHSWHYSSPRTLAGALQHGLGRGAHLAMSDPSAPKLVADYLRRDYRWDWQVDEREIYLARLVRDLRLPVEPIAARLFHAPAEKADDDNEFATTLGVLEVLGRAGIDGVVDEVRRYITHGERWLEALTTVAISWPAEYWDDLHPVMNGRLDTAASKDVLWRSPPWPRWAERDPRIAAAVRAAGAHVRPLTRPYASDSDDALLAVLAEPARAADWRPVLRELRCRPPDLRLLDLADGMLAADGVAGTRIAPLLGATLARLGAGAVAAARLWAATPDHPLLWTAFRLLAAHGDDRDAPAVVAGLDWLDNRPEDLCGYDELVGGLASIGGPTATAAVPRLRRLWYSPHSYERPVYLQALVALDPTGAERFLVEGLWDCETKVRLLAAQHAPLTDMTRERLRYLRDDPIEDADVRAATSTRLG